MRTLELNSDSDYILQCQHTFISAILSISFSFSSSSSESDSGGLGLVLEVVVFLCWVGGADFTALFGLEETFFGGVVFTGDLLNLEASISISLSESS